MPLKNKNSAVFILGISSDIGKAIAQRYLRQGHIVAGSYRNMNNLKSLDSHPRLHLLKCDLSMPDQIHAMARQFAQTGLQWETLVSCVGTMNPIGSFFSIDFESWQESVFLNSTAQLHALHALYPFRINNEIASVIFLAGGGTNSTFTNYSAYCVAKIMLIKMCELLDDENPKLKIFIVGPGWVRTKIHQETLESEMNALNNYDETLAFLSASKSTGTRMEDIFGCLQWLNRQSKSVVSGRNFSVVHDPWNSEKSEQMLEDLLNDPHMFKLRRFKNARR